MPALVSFAWLDQLWQGRDFGLAAKLSCEPQAVWLEPFGEA